MTVRDYQFQIATRDLSHLSKVYLVPLADFHEGARDADHKISDGYIRWIAERENAFTILNGDMLNCATKTSTPELYEDMVTVEEAYQHLLVRLDPIKDKILMITRGGHEEKIYRTVGIDLMARLAHDLGDIPYKPDGGMFALKLGDSGGTMVFTGYATHGWGGARTVGAKVKKVEDLALVADVDIYVLSHDHTQVVHRLNVLRPPRSSFSMERNQYMRMDRKILVNTGGFVEYDGYIRRKGYAPQDLGTPRIRLEVKVRSNGKRNVERVKDIHASV